jgi:hypothetical protein
MTNFIQRFKQRRQLIGRILKIKMRNFQYTLVPKKYGQEDEYRCLVDIYIDPKYMYHQEDLISYLRCANYQYISITHLGRFVQVSFQFDIIIDDKQGVVDMTNNIKDDFHYVLGVLSNEKKILKHYLSIVRT